MRPCSVDGKKALFHKWVHDYSNEKLFGLVEMEDGTVHLVDIVRINFLDTKSKMLDFVNFFTGEEYDENN